MSVVLNLRNSTVEEKTQNEIHQWLWRRNSDIKYTMDEDILEDIMPDKKSQSQKRQILYGNTYMKYLE